jgi:hypothetical protein
MLKRRPDAALVSQQLCIFPMSTPASRVAIDRLCKILLGLTYPALPTKVDRSVDQLSLWVSFAASYRHDQWATFLWYVLTLVPVGKTPSNAHLLPEVPLQFPICEPARKGQHAKCEVVHRFVPYALDQGAGLQLTQSTISNF